MPEKPTVSRRFRKKPVVIEAVRWAGDNGRELQEWNGHARWRYHGSELQIPTPEGVMSAFPGDWIIRGVKGEFYPCKPDIFEATYGPPMPDPRGLKPVAPQPGHAFVECDGGRDACKHCHQLVGDGYVRGVFTYFTLCGKPASDPVHASCPHGQPYPAECPECKAAFISGVDVAVR